MRPFLLLSLVPTLFGAQAASAQDASFYHCDNRPVRVAIGSMPLKDALAAFTKATHCPVSLDTRKVGDMPAGDVTTTVTKGRFPPARTLRLMLRNTPFKSRPIKGGFSITQ